MRYDPKPFHVGNFTVIQPRISYVKCTIEERPRCHCNDFSHSLCNNAAHSSRHSSFAER